MAKKKAKAAKKMARSAARPGAAMKKAGKAKSGKVVAKKSASPKPQAARTNNRPTKAVTSWLDDDGNKSLIDSYARKLGPFLQAMADGKVDQRELAAQEKRLIKLMQEVEPRLSPELHEQVTHLLCELTAYDMMHILHTMQATRAVAEWRG